MIKILLKGVTKPQDVVTPIAGVEVIFKSSTFLPSLSKKDSDGNVSKYTMSSEEKSTFKDEAKVISKDGHLGVLKLVYANVADEAQEGKLLAALDTTPSFYFALESGNIELAKARLAALVASDAINALDEALIVKYVDMLKG